MMTLNDLREKHRSSIGHNRFITENRTTSYDGFFDRWIGYFNEDITLDTQLPEEQILELTLHLFESIDSSISH